MMANIANPLGVGLNLMHLTGIKRLAERASSRRSSKHISMFKGTYYVMISKAHINPEAPLGNKVLPWLLMGMTIQKNVLQDCRLQK